MSRITDVAEGLQILAKYPDADIYAEHDIIFAGGTQMTVSKEDEKRLEELGWHIDRETDSWSRFV